MTRLILLLCFFVIPLLAKEKRYWVFFLDKGECEYLDLSELAKLYPVRCLERRAKVGAAFDWHDLPVSKNYITETEKCGARVHAVSRWLNGVSVYADTHSIIELARLPFVKDIRMVPGFRRGYPDVIRECSNLIVDPTYGVSYDQLVRLGIPQIHRFNFTGNGVIIGVFDTGFNIFHPVFSRMNLLATYDFIYNDTIVFDEPGIDPFGQDQHGTAVLSIIGGYAPGRYIGGAYSATFVLAKTEDVSSETPIEEDNWIRASEWAESLGVDIITSSVGYWEWYTPSDMDGRTAPISICASRLARLGVLLCNAAGNSGPSPMTIVAPADADSIISVGAIDTRDYVAIFSSRGPTADGRIKPDLVAPGMNIYIASSIDTTAYYAGSGTSFATPLLACLAGLLIQLYPYKTPMEIIDMLKRSATNSDYPNNDYGWGKPNGVIASAFYDSTTYLYFLFEGWNLVSLPVRVGSGFRFDGQIGNFYAYNGSGYTTTETPNVGIGYFVLIERDTFCLVSGERSADLSLPLRAGWNLIGGGGKRFVSKLERVIYPFSSFLPGTAYEYDPLDKRYKPVSGFAPTKGYWIFLLNEALYEPEF